MVGRVQQSSISYSSVVFPFLVQGALGAIAEDRYSLMEKVSQFANTTFSNLPDWLAHAYKNIPNAISPVSSFLDKYSLEAKIIGTLTTVAVIIGMSRLAAAPKKIEPKKSEFDIALNKARAGDRQALEKITKERYLESLSESERAEIFQLLAELRSSVNDEDGSLVNLMGCMYYNGFGTPVKFDHAIRCFYEGMDRGSVQAIVNLAVCFECGTGVIQDKKTAVEFYKKAANVYSVHCSRYRKDD